VRWTVLVLAGLLVMSAGTAVPGLPAPRAAAPVALEVDLFNSSVEVNTSAADRDIFLPGDVVVDYVILVTVRVKLSVSTDLGWPAEVDPAEMSFTTRTPQYFNVTVAIPGGTQNRSALLTVRGNATIPPSPAGYPASDTAAIVVSAAHEGGGGPPVIPHGKPGHTGVDLPPFPLMIAAGSLGAIAGSAYLLWWRKSGRAVKPAKRKAGRK